MLSARSDKSMATDARCLVCQPHHGGRVNGSGTIMCPKVARKSSNKAKPKKVRKPDIAAAK